MEDTKKLEPYAYVQYRLDKEKRKVPLSFFEKIDLFDIKYNDRYWVFWSKVEDDTPAKMLQRKHKIPQFEKSEDVNTEHGAGYYRATVSVVKGRQHLISLVVYLFLYIEIVIFLTYKTI